jgi:hypothetical protein
MKLFSVMANRLGSGNLPLHPGRCLTSTALALENVCESVADISLPSLART